MIADADIAWVDMQPTLLTAEAIRAAGPGLKWVATIYAGLDALPLDVIRARGAVLPTGVGIDAIAVAEYAVMGVLVAAKRYDEVVRLADRHEWTMTAPGQVELLDTTALIVGMGAIGALIAERLRAFGVSVTGVPRSGRDGSLPPAQWCVCLGVFVWVVFV